MALLELVLELAVIVTAMLVTTALVVIGPRRLAVITEDFRWRLEVAALPVGVLVTVLFVRWATGDFLPRLSERVVGIRITGAIFHFEESIFGVNPVTAMQSVQHELLTEFFIFIYIYAYAFLLVFPVLAYFVLEEMDEFSSLIMAYTANYAIGIVLYVLFIAMGPRNYDPLLFEPILYETFPQSGYLTHSVNEATNVFPSLHTSIAMTVFIMALITRDRYPLWVPISGFLAISVAASTMYLGIHWFSDVVAGTALAVVSVYLGVNYSIHGLVNTARLYVVGQLERRADFDR